MTSTQPSSVMMVKMLRKAVPMLLKLVMSRLGLGPDATQMVPLGQRLPYESGAMLQRPLSSKLTIEGPPLTPGKWQRCSSLPPNSCTPVVKRM